jgi:hypothetical protein
MMFHTKVVEKIKTHILCSVTFFQNPCRLWYNVEKFGRARQATDDNIIWRMRFAYWVTKSTDTHTHNKLTLTVIPQQKPLGERASILRYKFGVCLVSLSKRQVRKWRPVVSLAIYED